ncbi:MAG: M61 family metallopeptidase [Planctomycetota bacterium]|jgi:predicted metalloprotease with PDZ domain
MIRLLTLVLCAILAFTARAQMSLRVDATEIEKSLIHASVTMPASGGELELFYVQYVPGNHLPSAALWNSVDLHVYDERGNELRWDRDPLHVFRVVVTVPEGVEGIEVRHTYIANQPWVYSESTDSYGRPGFGGINWNNLVWYPGDLSKNELLVAAHLTLPAGWEIATDLPRLGRDANDETYHFDIVTLAQLIDSPIIFGAPEQLATVTLDDGDPRTRQYFHGVALEPDNLVLPEMRVSTLNEMLRQTHAVFGAYPHEEFHFLALLGDFPGLGVEHNTSTYFDMDADEWVTCEEPGGSSMGVVPHEYIHVWCGKLRSPVGLETENYHTPVDAELLWVYEGLTSYYDDVISARSGLITREEYLDSLEGTLFRYATQSGRSWRSVQDTGRGMMHLRASQPRWVEKIRRQDYYSEGALFWMLADATIRGGTNNERSLDDFCRAFFDVEFVSFGEPVEYTRDDVIAGLGDVYPGADWDALVSRYMESTGSTITEDLSEVLGLTMREVDYEPLSLARRERSPNSTLSLNTIGLYASEEGQITTILDGMPADEAGLVYGMEIVAINGESFSREVLGEAIASSVELGGLELTVEHYGRVTSIEIPYGEGARYPMLVRDPERLDVIAWILTPILRTTE